MSQLVIALKRAALHLFALIVCVVGLYALKQDHLPSSSNETIFAVAMLLLFGFVSALKLIGSLSIVAWHGLWLVTGGHSRGKRQVELWACVILLLGLGVAIFAVGVKGLFSGEVLYPLSRHVGYVSVSEVPYVFWASELINLGFGVLCIVTASHVGFRLARGLPPNLSVEGTLRDKTAQRHLP